MFDFLRSRMQNPASSASLKFAVASGDHHNSTPISISGKRSRSQCSLLSYIISVTSQANQLKSALASTTQNLSHFAVNGSNSCRDKYFAQLAIINTLA